MGLPVTVRVMIFVLVLCLKVLGKPLYESLLHARNSCIKLCWITKLGV